MRLSRRHIGKVPIQAVRFESRGVRAGVSLSAMNVNRFRRAYNWCYIRARPIRRACRDPKQRYQILKWSLAAMLAYLLLYTSFYIIMRNMTLFSMDDTSTELMEQYSFDLKACWHTKEEESEVTNLPMQIMFHSEHTLQSLKHTQGSSKETIRNVLVMPHRNYVYGEHIDSLLDAGMCIATPISSNNHDKNGITDKNSQNQHHTLHPLTSNVTSLGTIDTTRYTSRCLPHFVIAGAMKCGTGELMKWLQLHPSLAVGSKEDKRELHYFTSIGVSDAGDETYGNSVSIHDNTRSKDNGFNITPVHSLRGTNTTNTHTKLNNDATSHSISRRLREPPATTNHINTPQHAIKPSKLIEYSQFFPAFDATQLGNVLTFEKSPDYIRDPAALKRIRYYMPRVKMIVLLRNPVLRALSEFSHHCRHKRYIKLIRNVTMDRTLYTSGSVLRNDVHSTHKNGAIPFFPINSYEVLSYPCSAADAEIYFNMHHKIYHHKITTTTMTSEYNHTTPHSTHAEHTIPHSTLSTNTSETTYKSKRVHFVPEIEHGMYDHQLTALYEIFPADQILVLLQEDMYSHTFRTLRQVESFLKIGCFDYQEYAIIPTSSVAAKPTLDSDADNAGDNSLTDDMNIHESIVASSSPMNNDKGSHNNKKKGNKGKKQHLKPPRRAPRTYDEKLKHYKEELAQYLASWKGLSMTPSVNIYDNTSPAFKEYLHSVYADSNKKLSTLLYGKYKNEAFSKEHLIEMGWDMGVV